LQLSGPQTNLSINKSKRKRQPLQEKCLQGVRKVTEHSTRTHSPSAILEKMFHYWLIVEFDAYRNLQRHRAVLPALARLSCKRSLWTSYIFREEGMWLLTQNRLTIRCIWFCCSSH